MVKKNRVWNIKTKILDTETNTQDRVTPAEIESIPSVWSISGDSFPLRAAWRRLILATIVRAAWRRLFLASESIFNDRTTQTALDPLAGSRFVPGKSFYTGSNEGRGPVPSVQP